MLGLLHMSRQLHLSVRQQFLAGHGVVGGLFKSEIFSTYLDYFEIAGATINKLFLKKKSSRQLSPAVFSGTGGCYKVFRLKKLNTEVGLFRNCWR